MKLFSKLINRLYKKRLERTGVFENSGGAWVNVLGWHCLSKRKGKFYCDGVLIQ